MGPAGAKNRMAVICGLLELLGLAVWVGGLIVIIGAVIPAVFNFGMETGGRALARVFDAYNRLVAGAIVVLVSASAWRVWSWRRGMHAEAQLSRAEILLLTIMVMVSAVITMWLGPDSVLLQERAFAAQGVEAKKAAYEAFFRSHAIVRALYVTNLALGVALMAVKVRNWVGGVKM